MDSHAHLTDSAFDGDRQTVIDSARAAGAAAIICVSTDEADTLQSRALASEFPDFVYGTAGVHPHAAGRYDARSDRTWIRDAVAHGAVAIGECGLDYHYDHSPRPQQRASFLDQIALAGELDRPVIVHNRESDTDMEAIVREAGASGVRGVLHSFSGSAALADTALAAGWYLSFSGMVTFRRWDADAVVRSVPDDRLLVETDAPYLAPVPMRGQRNEPRFVPYILARVAEVRGTSAGVLAQTVIRNTRQLFSAPGAHVVTSVPSDIEIAQAAKPRPIVDVAADLGLGPDELDLYGKYKAKIALNVTRRPAKGRLVLVTGINPTAAGEGKTTTAVGLAQAFRRLGAGATLCIREPSLGPVFGVKGGAAGGGYAQVIPMEDINLHFTGDFHAIASAHSLLSAMLDNHIHQGNSLRIDVRRVTWPRTIDMNDRALRDAVIGLGGVANGFPREERWVIIPASEIMAIVALATDPQDLEARLARIIVGATAGAERAPIRAGELKAAGAMALLLKDAIRPNLVQTLEGGPAFVHAGPFGNIAHGCNSILATRAALALSDIVVTEAGFGSDLGAEKFFDIKCRIGGLNPEAAVLVATVRALKLNGGANKTDLKREDLVALERGLANLDGHIANVSQFGVPVVVAINRFTTDTERELTAVADRARAAGAAVALTEVWEKGGEGAIALAHEVQTLLASGRAHYAPLYPVNRPIREKIETIVQRVYGGSGVNYSTKAARTIDYLESIGLSGTPICMAKTQYSFTDDPTILGRPSGFRITIGDVYPAAGAGFVVAQAGEIMTMPGLPKEPAAERMAIRPDGSIVGLF